MKVAKKKDDAAKSPLAPQPPDLPYIEPSLRSLAVLIDSVTPDPSNARVHPARNLEAIRASLATFRQQKPIVVDADGVCRKGNGTLATMKALGFAHVAAVRSELRGEAAIAYAIADNKTSDLGEWDYEMLGNVVREVGDDALLAATGFDDRELDMFRESEWSPPEVDPSAFAPTAGAGEESSNEPDGLVSRSLSGPRVRWDLIDRAVAKARERAGNDKLPFGAALARIVEVYRGPRGGT